MKTLGVVISFTCLITLTYKAIVFHRQTICRQQIWLKALELKTNSLLHHRPTDVAFLPKCQATLYLQDGVVSWKQIPNLKTRRLELQLKGKL